MLQSLLKVAEDLTFTAELAFELESASLGMHIMERSIQRVNPPQGVG